MIEIRMTEANARWLLECVNVNCSVLARGGKEDAPAYALWLERDALREELLTVLGDLDEKAQAGTMTPTERVERTQADSGFRKPPITAPGRRRYQQPNAQGPVGWPQGPHWVKQWGPAQAR